MTEGHAESFGEANVYNQYSTVIDGVFIIIMLPCARLCVGASQYVGVWVSLGAFQFLWMCELELQHACVFNSRQWVSGASGTSRKHQNDEQAEHPAEGKIKLDTIFLDRV